jgi:glycerol transport system ATP-binding protein
VTLLVDGLAAGGPVRFERGRLNVVLGRNGAGKTALCRRIAGLDAPGGLGVRLDGADLTDLDPRRRSVGMVFGEFVNYPPLTVRENLALPLRAAGVPRGEIAERVGAAAAAVGLTAELGRLPEALSGGQQQRVALARALVRRPAILLLDEPLVNLDYKLRESMGEELRALLAGAGTVVVYTSADPREALEMADSVVLMHAGAAIQQGAPLEVLRAPAGAVAADLLCDPGLNRAGARRDGAVLRLDGGLEVPLPAGAPAADALVVGIRPDHLRRAGEVAGGLVLPAEVQLAETNGSDTWLHVRVADADWVAHLPGRVDAEPGARLDLAVDPADLLLFDAGAAA